MDDDDDDDAYRARPVIAGVLCPAGVLHTCAEYSAAWLGPSWLLGQVVETVWVVSANLIDRWWLSVYGYSSAPLQG